MKPSVLIIDDSSSDRRLITASLTERFGNSITIAETERVESAAPLLIAGKVDIVTLDLNLPGISGPAALNTVLSYDRSLSVVILTGSGDDRELEIQCLAHGAVAFCGKDVFDRLPDLVLAAWQHRSQRRDQLAGITDRLTSISTILSNNARTISCLDAETRRLAEKLDGTDDEPGFITIVRLVDRDFRKFHTLSFRAIFSLVAIVVTAIVGGLVSLLLGE